MSPSGPPVARAPIAVAWTAAAVALCASAAAVAILVTAGGSSAAGAPSPTQLFLSLILVVPGLLIALARPRSALEVVSAVRAVAGGQRVFGASPAGRLLDLSVSPITVRNHLGSIFGKLHVSTRGQAVARVRGAGSSGGFHR